MKTPTAIGTTSPPAYRALKRRDRVGDVPEKDPLSPSLEMRMINQRLNPVLGGRVRKGLDGCDPSLGRHAKIGIRGNFRESREKTESTVAFFVEEDCMRRLRLGKC
jgi:hypothetical protein